MLQHTAGSCEKCELPPSTLTPYANPSSWIWTLSAWFSPPLH
ncbi:hypothetical protein AAFF_G00149720 [Aldrovandia affinis]|uniref:Uncharacterized protein n=1 Tax=Aldrovandia affinis TaxID=143900 RepID=A0AAD7W8X5_9TELE|nr:hypothetical protein AAFF_G00149720 [Aldrovandia affinis]